MAYAARDVIGTHQWVDARYKAAKKTRKLGRDWEQIKCLKPEDKCIVVTCAFFGGILGAGIGGTVGAGAGAVPGAVAGIAVGIGVGFAIVGACNKTNKN
jgi:hypothetical protein